MRRPQIARSTFRNSSTLIPTASTRLKYTWPMALMFRAAASKIQERGQKRPLHEMHISLQFRVGCLLLLSVFPAFAASAQTNCAPPESMKARFTGKPDPAALNDLGAWFGEHNDFTCAAEAFATSLQMD